MGLAELQDLLDRLPRYVPLPRALSPKRWSVAEVERRIANEAVEWGYIFRLNGVQVARVRGAATTVSFTGLEHLLHDAIVIHNHPVGPNDAPEALTFSLLDLVFAVRHDVAEMRVVAGEWRFVLRRPDRGWPADEEIVAAVYNERRAEVVATLSAAVSEGRITPFEFEMARAHETLRSVANWGNFEYQRERWSWQ